MEILTYIEMSLGVLKQNKSRSFLTALGIIIGVAAVIAMLSVGEGAKKAIDKQMSNLGTNVLQVFPGSTSSNGVKGGFGTRSSLTPADVQAIKNSVREVTLISPIVSESVQAKYGNQNWSTKIQGTSTDYFSIKNWQVQKGAFFTESDISGSAKVCVLGQTVVDNLFPGEEPVGQTIRIKSTPFVVLGVLAKKGSSFGGDQDDNIIIPYTTAMKRIVGVTYVNSVQVSIGNATDMSAAETNITELLIQRHKIRAGEDNDFQIMNMADMKATASSMMKIMTMLLSSVASVSLLVGGIGIMNIMLVSVTERTREIGIRMAVGAKQKEILFQFVIEALMLSLAGGIVGIGLGVIISLLISVFAKWSIIISFGSIALAFFFSMGIGIFFGYYPARRAAGLDPIQALRYE